MPLRNQLNTHPNPLKYALRRG